MCISEFVIVDKLGTEVRWSRVAKGEKTENLRFARNEKTENPLPYISPDRQENLA